MEQDDNILLAIETRHALNIRTETFDKFIDLALDGVVTMEEAISGFKELYSEPAAE